MTLSVHTHTAKASGLNGERVLSRQSVSPGRIYRMRMEKRGAIEMLPRLARPGVSQ